MAVPADLVLMIRPADTADQVVLQNFDALHAAFEKTRFKLWSLSKMLLML